VGSSFFWRHPGQFTFIHPILKPNLGKAFCCTAKDLLSSSVLSKCVNIKIDKTKFTCILSVHNLSPFEGTNINLECLRAGCSGECFGLKEREWEEVGGSA
jgi:hypothetical protein